jgi:hypothetical protein
VGRARSPAVWLCSETDDDRSHVLDLHARALCGVSEFCPCLLGTPFARGHEDAYRRLHGLVGSQPAREFPGPVSGAEGEVGVPDDLADLGAEDPGEDVFYAVEGARCAGAKCSERR